jgi:RNase adapter protein RapZ
MQHVVFVTGLSGAGKSQAMKTFEDLGFYCVDNLPPALVPATLELLERAQRPAAALALDVRTGGPLGEALATIDGAGRDGRSIEVLFVDARDEALVRRYSETRHRHPFHSAGSLREAIAAERAALAPLRERSTRTIDTTALTHAALRERIAGSFAAQAGAGRLYVSVVAFGFKFGVPLDADLLFDVRFLRNPNYDDALRPLTGLDPQVAAFVEADPALEPFLTRVIDLLEFLLPRYVVEGKTQLTIAFGCTGGRHRSVYVARRIVEKFGEDPRMLLALELRDAAR